MNIFAVYSELLAYEPFKCVIEALKTQRPPMGSEIGGPLFKFVRNIFAHFPVFETWDEVWDEVWVSKELVNWQKEGLTIDRFLKKYADQDKVKYRFWEADKERMAYMSVHFPRDYGNNKIHLKNMIK